MARLTAASAAIHASTPSHWRRCISSAAPQLWRGAGLCPFVGQNRTLDV